MAISDNLDSEWRLKVHLVLRQLSLITSNGTLIDKKWVAMEKQSSKEEMNYHPFLLWLENSKVKASM